MLALARYKELVLEFGEQQISAEQSQEIDRSISGLRLNAETAEGQRAAFAQVASLISAVTSQELDAAENLAAREQARQALGLPLFPDVSVEAQNTGTVEPPILEKKASRLLDVEVVAIYW